MRSIGSFNNEVLAHRFADFLYARGIENEMEADEKGNVVIWVLHDDHVTSATQFLSQFRSNPNALEFQDAPVQAELKRQQAERADSSRQATVADQARVAYEQQFSAIAYVPIALIILCIAVGIYSQFGENRKALAPFFIATVGGPQGSFTLADVASGQVWRLLTPIFIHFGFLHFFFNMMWLRDFGTFVENRFGMRYLLVLVAVIGVLSNLTQYFVSGPFFGGMSGVNYGLLGFLWMRGRFDRNAGWRLNPTIVWTMLIWFFACLVGVISHVANGAHAAGLILGMAWGYASSGRLRFSR